MAILPLTDRTAQRNTAQPLAARTQNVYRVLREQVHRKQMVNIILMVIAAFQLIDLPGAIMMKSSTAVGTVILGLVLCGIALIFNQVGKVTIVSILLIAVVDLGCGLMLLTTPMGLDVSDLPIFDVLIVSELIAVSLLPPMSVFPVAISNIAFIVADLALQPKTSGLSMVLTSSMGFDAIVQPISLQIVVAIISFIWVQNALVALARADRAEEIAAMQQREAEMQRREAERQQHIEVGVQHLSQILVQAANGDRTARAQMSQDNMLWRIGNSLNLLLTRLMRTGQLEQENKRLRAELTTLMEARHLDRMKAYSSQPLENDQQARGNRW